METSTVYTVTREMPQALSFLLHSPQEETGQRFTAILAKHSHCDDERSRALLAWGGNMLNQLRKKKGNIEVLQKGVKVLQSSLLANDIDGQLLREPVLVGRITMERAFYEQCKRNHLIEEEAVPHDFLQEMIDFVRAFLDSKEKGSSSSTALMLPFTDLGEKECALLLTALPAHENNRKLVEMAALRELRFSQKIENLKGRLKEFVAESLRREEELAKHLEELEKNFDEAGSLAAEEMKRQREYIELQKQEILNELAQEREIREQLTTALAEEAKVKEKFKEEASQQLEALVKKCETIEQKQIESARKHTEDLHEFRQTQEGIASKTAGDVNKLMGEMRTLRERIVQSERKEADDAVRMVQLEVQIRELRDRIYAAENRPYESGNFFARLGRLF